MAEYEVVHEIKNLCRNNQMRDIFFEEIECEDPETYVRNKLEGKEVEISVEENAEGCIVYANVNGLIQKFIFTLI